MRHLTMCPVCRFGFEGVLLAIYGFDREPLECNEEDVHKCIFKDGADVLKQLDVEKASFFVDFAVLCLFFVLLRIGCYFVLKWRVKMH